jgi:hypothetical protein
MTKSLFVIAIVMCLNISVVSPLFAETREQCISNANWRIWLYKTVDAFGTGIGAMGSLITMCGIYQNNNFYRAIGAGTTAVGATISATGKGFRASNEYHKDEICSSLQKKSAAAQLQNTDTDEEEKET